MLVLLLPAALPVAVSLDTLTVEHARTLAGRPVLVAFLAMKPAYTLSGVTVLGAPDQPDGVERTAVLAGSRLEPEGRRVTVLGRVRVIGHPGGVVNGAAVPGWVEVRASGAGN